MLFISCFQQYFKGCILSAGRTRQVAATYAETQMIGFDPEKPRVRRQPSTANQIVEEEEEEDEEHEEKQEKQEDEHEMDGSDGGKSCIVIHILLPTVF